MWTHYTNERGFCIEYETNRLLENFDSYQTYFAPVNYGDLKPIDFKKYSGKIITNNKVSFDSNIPLFYCLLNKEEFWNYEKEWRIIIRDINFYKVSNALDYQHDETLEYEQDQLKKRNLKYNDSCIKKIILSTYFFDNKRFNNKQVFGNIEVFHFTDNSYKKELKEFLEILIREYNNKIYQVDKYLENGKIIRDIKYKIEFLKMTENYLELKKTFF